MQLLTFAALTLAVTAAIPAGDLPKLPAQRWMVVKYNQKVVSEKKTFPFEEHHYYDTAGQLSRIDSINATTGKMMITKLDRPKAEGLSYQMDYIKNQCIEWDFDAIITGFAEFDPTMTKTSETIDGIACDKYSKTGAPSSGPTWTYTVWVSQKAPQIPVAVYSSNWEQKTPTGDTFDDGIRHVTAFNTTLPKGIFDASFPAKCSKPPAPPMGKCDAGASTCKPCSQGETGCSTMAVCAIQLKHKCGPLPGPDGYSCDWTTHTCKPDPTDPGQGKAACEALCHP
jgi:hypothetical protein